MQSYDNTPSAFFAYYPPGTPAYLFRWPPLASDYEPTGEPPAAGTGSTSSSGGVSRTSIITPAIVASIALIGSAILLISYYRVFAKYCAAWQQLWGLTSRSNRDPDEQVLRLQQEQALEQGWFLAMNAGLDESVVKRIPVYIFRSGEGIVGSHECSVCLGEFEDQDELRILPKCSHAFHLSCIDIWLQSHSNCPLCRAPVVSPRSESLLLPPPEQSISNRVEVEHPEEQQEQEEQVVMLQIEDPEQDRGTVHRSSQQETSVLRRSRSLSMEHAHYNRKSQRWRVPFLRRSYSTGSNLINYQDLLMSYDPVSISPANLILVPNNSAELGKQLNNLCEDDEESFVVINIEVASTSSSARASNAHPSSLLSVRKSGSFKASLKRSFSAGRVFSFRRFARSRSHA